MPRPKKAPGESRPQVIAVRFNETETAFVRHYTRELSKLVRGLDLSPSDALRALVHQAMETKAFGMLRRFENGEGSRQNSDHDLRPATKAELKASLNAVGEGAFIGPDGLLVCVVGESVEARALCLAELESEGVVR